MYGIFFGALFLLLFCFLLLVSMEPVVWRWRALTMGGVTRSQPKSLVFSSLVKHIFSRVVIPVVGLLKVRERMLLYATILSGPKNGVQL